METLESIPTRKELERELHQIGLRKFSDKYADEKYRYYFSSDVGFNRHNPSADIYARKECGVWSNATEFFIDDEYGGWFSDILDKFGYDSCMMFQEIIETYLHDNLQSELYTTTISASKPSCTYAPGETGDGIKFIYMVGDNRENFYEIQLDDPLPFDEDDPNEWYELGYDVEDDFPYYDIG